MKTQNHVVRRGPIVSLLLANVPLNNAAPLNRDQFRSVERRTSLSASGKVSTKRFIVNQVDNCFGQLLGIVCPHEQSVDAIVYNIAYPSRAPCGDNWKAK